MRALARSKSIFGSACMCLPTRTRPEKLQLLLPRALLPLHQHMHHARSRDGCTIVL